MTDEKKTFTELKDEELDVVTGGAKCRDNNMCSCGRGKVYQDGLCKHCYLAKMDK